MSTKDVFTIGSASSFLHEDDNDGLVRAGGSQKGRYGETSYFDTKHKFIGLSQEGRYGEIRYYDMNNRLVGSSSKGQYGLRRYYDASNRPICTSQENKYGAKHFYDRNNRKIGRSLDMRYGETAYYGSIPYLDAMLTVAKERANHRAVEVETIREKMLKPKMADGLQINI